LLCSLTAFQSAADARAPFPKVDPYTLGEAETLARVGHASFGPFLWGDGHSTAQVEQELGGVPLIWVETAHFKLGSSLPEYTDAKDIGERAKRRDAAPGGGGSECARLRESIRCRALVAIFSPDTPAGPSSESTRWTPMDEPPCRR
jgi:hypothetical protein